MHKIPIILSVLIATTGCTVRNQKNTDVYLPIKLDQKIELIDDAHENIVSLTNVDGMLVFHCEKYPKLPPLYIMVPTIYFDNGIGRDGYVGGWEMYNDELSHWIPRMGKQSADYLQLYLNLPIYAEDIDVYIRLSEYRNNELIKSEKFSGILELPNQAVKSSP